MSAINAIKKLLESSIFDNSVLSYFLDHPVCLW